VKVWRGVFAVKHLDDDAVKSADCGHSNSPFHSLAQADGSLIPLMMAHLESSLRW
jgi:hypothetical protein